MVESKKGASKPRAPAPERARETDDAERSLARAVAIGLPLLSVVAAIAIGLLATLGPALLVLASGALLGTIAFLWASVRTLSGDAPLPSELETLTVRRHGVDQLEQHKHRVLLALKDLESEHALGKLDDDDYATFVARYRDEAKAVMREMDLEVAPLRDQAERIAREYLEKLGTSGVTSVGATDETDDRTSCNSCNASNEPDAAFCKRCGAAMKTAEEAHAAK